MRWRNPGYGESLGEAIISEGMACLYEEQHIGKAPIYTDATLENEQVKKANEALGSENYDAPEWFFGQGSLNRWFGYALGYKLCKDYSEKTGKSASQMVNIPASDVLNESMLQKYK